MRVRVMISTTHPEYRLVQPVDAMLVPLHVQAAIEHLGPWRVTSEQEFDCADAEHAEALDDIAAQGAYLRLITADYIGRVAISPGS
jgi:hypothetical protein